MQWKFVTSPNDPENVCLESVLDKFLELDQQIQSMTCVKDHLFTLNKDNTISKFNAASISDAPIKSQVFNKLGPKQNGKICAFTVVEQLS